MKENNSEGIGLKLLALSMVIFGHIAVVYALLSNNNQPIKLVSNTYLDQTAGKFQATAKVEFFEVAEIPQVQEVKQEPISVKTEEAPDVNPEPEKKEPEKKEPEKKVEDKPKVEQKAKPKVKPQTKPKAKSTEKQNQKSNTEQSAQGREAKGNEGVGKDVATSANHLGGYLNNPKPNYPFQSLERGEQGTVVLTVVVEANGKPSSVQIKKSSGYPRLDRAALNTVRDYYTFIPATKGGVPVRSTYDFAIEFYLDQR
ncbi:hypothetical protein CKF54_00245 [Psittacicella hinzii]|uniref:TonB C-terminal domain-containing protein n=1 Tax=Psittacicella hinzii TaxID=2028575 RepID=A0A3A1YB89_9GAMM|nr:energy transducer TonB [Psittacicella hinzii]RIY34460.1 hypothetical protein CKF54_00245 [Psittacicella hinzii]